MVNITAPIGRPFLNDIPFELLCSILALCRIVDLLRLRQCSKQLKLASCDRSVWAYILNDMSSKMRLNSTHSLNVQKLDAAALEKVTTAHFRFRLRAKECISQNPDEPLPHMKSYILDTAVFPQDKWFGDCSCIRLMPGGRWLFFVVGFHAELWDLGFAPEDRKRIAIQDLPFPEENDGAPVEIVQVQHTRIHGDNMVFTIVTRVSDQHSFSVFSIPFLESNPVFTRLGTCRVRGPVRWLGFYHEKKVLFLRKPNSEPQEIGVHNFELDATVSWASGGTVYDDLDLVTEAGEDFVMATTASNTEAHFFPVPAFTSDSAGTVRMVNNIPSGYTSWPEEFERFGPIRSMQTTACLIAYPRVGPLNWEIILRTEDRKAVILSLTLVRLPDGSWKIYSVDESQYSRKDFPIARHDVPYTCTFPDLWRALWWEDDETESIIKLQYCSKAPDTTSKDEAFLGVLTKVDLEDGDDESRPLTHSRYSFQPFLGRGCYVQKEGIKVIDYIDILGS